MSRISLDRMNVTRVANDRVGRSYRPIEKPDLLRLLQLAREDREDFFSRYPDWAAFYADRVLCSSLCQGAALHYVRGNVGINDFDVYTFYAVHPERPWYAKRLRAVDFGNAKFGRSQVSPRGFTGRRLDLMARALNVTPTTDPVAALRRYLAAGESRTARELAGKAVVLLEPIERLGTIVWPCDD